MRYEVAVIGAGVAGSSAALRLSSMGHKTVMIDPCNKKKLCAGILTSQYAERYKIDDAYVERELKGVRLSFRDTKAEINYRKGVEYSIDREAYDSFNRKQALASGCDLKKETASFIDDNVPVIITDKSCIYADYVIVASGVSELCSLPIGAKQYAFCVQQKKYQKPEDYFEMELHSNGYSWISPKKDHVLCGASSRITYPDMPGERGIIPLKPARRTFFRRTLLTGDAAGFVSPFEGEGIYYAKRSGEIAAEVLSGAISGKNTLKEYEKRWRKEFDFSTLNIISKLLSNDAILEAFVREIRDNERFNRLVEDILTKKMRSKSWYIHSLIKTLR